MKSTSIVICQGSSCFSRGNKQNLALIQKFLKAHELDVDVSFKGQLCTGKCNESPIIIIDNKTFTNVNEVRMLTLLKTHFKVD